MEWLRICFWLVCLCIWRYGGNSWSSGPSPPSPPGVRRNRGSGSGSSGGGGGKSSVATGLTIAGIAFGVLFLLAILIAFFSRKKRSSNSHLLEEDRLNERKSFSMFSSRDLTKDLHSDYNGNSISSSLFLVETIAKFYLECLFIIFWLTLLYSYFDFDFANLFLSEVYGLYMKFGTVLD